MEAEEPKDNARKNVRIYQDGMSDDGQLITEEELGNLLSQGRLSRFDLLLDEDGVWKPLGSVFELPDEKEQDYLDENETELALKLEALPSLLSLGAEKVEASTKLAVAEGARNQRKKAVKIPWKWISLGAGTLALLLVLLYVLNVWIFVPWQNRRAWRCAYVLYRNDGNDNHEVFFEGEHYTVASKDVLVVRDVFGRSPRNSTFTVDMEGETVSVPIRLSAGKDFLVNPKGGREYGRFAHPEEIGKIALPQKLLDGVISELRMGRSSQSACELGEYLRAQVKKNMKDYSSKSVVVSDDNGFASLGLTRSEEYTQRHGAQVPSLVWIDLSKPLRIKDATLQVKSGAQKIECRFQMEVTRIHPLSFSSKPEVRELFADLKQEQISSMADVILKMEGQGGTLEIQCREQDQKVREGKITYEGNWTYVAALAAVDDNAKWQWRYIGKSKQNNKTLTLEVMPKGDKNRILK